MAGPCKKTKLVIVVTDKKGRTRSVKAKPFDLDGQVARQHQAGNLAHVEQRRRWF